MELHWPQFSRVAMAAALMLGGVATVAPPADAAKKKKPPVSAIAPNDFVLSTPVPAALGKGKTKLVIVAVKRGKGFKAPLTLRVVNPLAGVVAEVTKATTKSITVRLRADTTTAAQTGQVTVFADGGGVSKSTGITVNVAGGGAPAAAPPPAPAPTTAPAPTATPAPAPTPGPSPTALVAIPANPVLTALVLRPFTLRMDTFPLFVLAGNTTKLRVQVQGVNGKKAPEAKLTVSGLPPGWTATPTELVTSTEGEFIVKIPSGTPPTPFVVTVSGVAGGSTAKVDSEPIQVTIGPRIVAESVSKVTVPQGGAGAITVFTNTVGGITDTQISSASPTPGVSLTVAPRRTDGNSKISITVAQNVPPNVYDIVVVATDPATGSKSSVTLNLIVTSNGATEGFIIDSAFVDAPGVKNVPFIVPGFATPFVVTLASDQAGKPAPKVTFRFKVDNRFTVTPESLTIGGEVNNAGTFSLTFNGAANGVVPLDLVATQGALTKSMTRQINVTSKPILDLRCATTQLEQNYSSPRPSAFTSRIKLAKVLGMGPISSASVGGGGTSPTLIWSIKSSTADSVDLTIGLYPAQPIGNTELFDLVVTATGAPQPVVFRHPISVVPPNDIDEATTVGC